MEKENDVLVELNDQLTLEIKSLDKRHEAKVRVLHNQLRVHEMKIHSLSNRLKTFESDRHSGIWNLLSKFAVS